MLGQRDDVVTTLTQGRQHHGQHGEPVVEVLAEAPLAHRGPQILVRRGEDPHVDRLVARRAEPPHAALFEHLEQLRLERLGQEPDLVEEDRAPVGRLEQARLGAAGVGERPALEAEHLGLQQRVGDRRAVDVHEGAVRARAGAMDHPREQPLAAAGLALDEDRRQPPDLLLALEQPGDLVADGPHARTVPQEVGQRLHAPAS